MIPIWGAVVKRWDILNNLTKRELLDFLVLGLKVAFAAHSPQPYRATGLFKKCN